MKNTCIALCAIILPLLLFSQAPAPDISVGTISNTANTTSTGDNTASGNDFSGLPGNDFVFAFTTNANMSLRVDRIGGAAGSQLFLLDSVGNQLAVSAGTVLGFEDLPIGDYFLILDAPVGVTGSFTIDFRPLISNFSANPSSGCAVPHTVFFTDTSTLPDTWSWDFGDGNTSTLQNPIHTYTTTGDFDVLLTVRDTIAGISHISPIQNINVSVPTAGISGTGADFFSGSPGGFFGCGPLTANFLDASTVNGSGNIVAWLWDFGDGNTSTLQNPTNTYQDPGVFSVSLTITLDNGCTDTLTLNNFVQVIGPNIDFISDVTSGSVDLTVNFTDTTTFGAPIISWNWDFGDGGTSNLQNPTHTYTTIGMFDVSLTVADIDGCSRTLTRNAFITVTDDTPPVANCVPPFAIQLDATGSASITVADIDNGSTDNIAIASTIIDITDFDCSNVGDNIVTLTVTDSSGNTANCTTTVTVQDNLPPVVITQDITVSLDATGSVGITPAAIDNGSSDNCGIDTLSLDITDFDCNDLGANTVTLTVTDVNGNSASETAIVTVQDNLPPVVITQDITVSLDATGSVGITPAAIDNGSSDNCGIDTLSLDITDFDCNDLGANTVTLTVTDMNGNSASGTATVTVQDDLPPTIVTQDVTIALDLNGQATINVEDIDNGSFDNCEIANRTINITDFDCPALNTPNTIVFTVTDINGNTSSAEVEIVFTAPDEDQDGIANPCDDTLNLDINPILGISPNADGQNDTWVIEGITSFPTALVQVFDRNGVEVFSTQNYQNDWGANRNGDGALLPVGPYFFTISFVGETGTSNTNGWMYINY